MTRVRRRCGAGLAMSHRGSGGTSFTGTRPRWRGILPGPAY